MNDAHGRYLRKQVAELVARLIASRDRIMSRARASTQKSNNTYYLGLAQGRADAVGYLERLLDDDALLYDDEEDDSGFDEVAEE